MHPTPVLPAKAWHLFLPKSITVLRQGYGWLQFRADAFAGLTVAIIALPLAMALSIASGATPERGLFTAVVAGFLISLLGGSRYQIGGPTGAFVVVVFRIIEDFGYDGLVIATLMAGLILIVLGFARFGSIIKYIPYPVITGFTSAIALIIFSSQVKDLLGLHIDKVPSDFLEKWWVFAQNFEGANSAAIFIGGFTLSIILLVHHYRPAWPGFLIAIVLASTLAGAVNINVETIGSRFGDIPSSLPAPYFPAISFERLRELLPSAATIAFLAGIESLLSAVIADGMTGARHRSNCELVAQGIANFVSACFGGLPATGALARTAANIKAGAKSPIAGMLHAVFLLVFMWLLAPIMSWVPLSALAAVLVMVAWNMSEAERFYRLLRAPIGDQAVLIVTFLLTILVDITVAVTAGVALAGLLFTRRMTESSQVTCFSDLFQNDVDDLARMPDQEAAQARQIPSNIQVFQFTGPFFFGAASKLNDLLEQIGKAPRVFILRFENVPFIDATGAHALDEFISKCLQHGIHVTLSEVSPEVMRILLRMRITDKLGDRCIAQNLDQALELAKEKRPKSKPHG